ncbi:MAG: DUF4398 domain-containing protein [Burkholderiaceae bacterium]|nr:DUF4398 domain-containing protein [Burkholderiaceae bacterium]MDZ4161811.1 DUF4398 domain-containing protein [Burkholderiales bacterium]
MPTLTTPYTAPRSALSSLPTSPSADTRLTLAAIPPGATGQPRRHGGLLAALLVAPVLLGACASSVPVPNTQLAAARTAVTSAASAGAADLAPTELGMARDKLTQANAAVADQNLERATFLARESQVDANLAESKARSLKAQKAAGQLAEGNRVLREELQRSAK